VSNSTFWIWGRHPVLEGLRAGRVRGVLLVASGKVAPVVQDIRRLAEERGVPVRLVSPAEIEQVAPGENTQGVAAEMMGPALVDLDSLCDQLQGTDTIPFLLATDQIQDPHNVGALLRTAEAAGVGGIVMPEHRGAPLSGTVAKVSAGALSYLPIAVVTNLAQALDRLKDRGIWAVGLDGEARQTVFQADLRVPLVLVVGSEGEGLRRLTRERCDFLVKLPMAGHIESLNASVAGSIAMYEVVRQRLSSGA
jgi:23S rRNA (guanosine2251-2'-O)-methyltransferase